MYYSTAFGKNKNNQSKTWSLIRKLVNATKENKKYSPKKLIKDNNLIDNSK